MTGKPTFRDHCCSGDDRDGPRNVGLIAFEQPDAAAGPKMFH
jgi:hypothetical protein